MGLSNLSNELIKINKICNVKQIHDALFRVHILSKTCLCVGVGGGNLNNYNPVLQSTNQKMFDWNDLVINFFVKIYIFFHVIT